MKTNTGSLIQDTSSGTATKILVWLNSKYKDIWRRVNWTAITDDDFTFESAVGTSLYDLPTDFEEELFLANIANGESIQRVTEGEFWRDRTGAHQADTIPNGTVRRYVILEETKITSGVVRRQIRLDPPPSVVDTYALPYKRSFIPLIATTGTATTDTSNKVIDSNATFITDGVETGMIIHNVTDNTFGLVVTVDSETQITAGSDITPDGDSSETYTVGNHLLIPDIDDVLELGAIGEAFAYQGQFAKANFYMQKYEIELRRRLGQERSKINQRYQRVSESYRTGGVRRLLGDLSYDQIT